MKSFRKIFTTLIGFDRRERRGTYILSVMLVVLLVVRLVAFSPGKVPEDVAILASLTPVAGSEQSGANEAVRLPVLFSFDPNDATYDDLLKLGLTERQAHTLMNYRSSGAHFRRPEDLLKVYGVDSATALRLIPYIIIADKSPDRRRDGLPNKDALTEKLFSDRAQSSPGATEKLSSDRMQRSPGATEKLSSDGAVRFSSGSERPSYGSERPSHGSEKSLATARKLFSKPLTDLNRCTALELAQLPGIGPVLSERIVRYRRLLGGFIDTQQLGEVYGLDSTVISLITPHLTLTFDSVTPIVLDSASFGDLARHPYVGYETARAVTRYRSIAGSPLTLGVMVDQSVITHQQAERLAPYVKPSPGTAGDDYEFISSKVLK